MEGYAQVFGGNMAADRIELRLGALLGKGLDARRRSLSMKTEELERRIKALEADVAGQAGTIEQRRVKIREEIGGIKVAAQKDLDKFVEDTIRQLPDVIDSAKKEDLRKFLPAFLEDTFKTWAEAARSWADGKSPKTLPVAGKAAKPAKTDVFVYFIAGAKERNPAAAQALLKALKP